MTAYWSFVRELNPHCLLGRQECYRYTNEAFWVEVRDSNSFKQSHRLPCCHYTNDHIFWLRSRESNSKGRAYGARVVSVPLRNIGTKTRTRTLIMRFWRPPFYQLNYPDVLEQATGFEPVYPTWQAGVIAAIRCLHIRFRSAFPRRRIRTSDTLRFRRIHRGRATC